MRVALLSLALVLPSAPAAFAQDEGEAGRHAPDGQVLTYYGLRKLEHDESVSDEDKLREWQDFIRRAKEHIAYAETAVERWKNAAQLRVIESVQKDDHDPKLRPSDKMERWQRILDLYPKSKEARLAQQRMAFWRGVETKLRVEAAEEVERERKSKVERIRAWALVAEWVQKGSEAKAAEKRIEALRDQLFAEAKSLDRIARVDDATKLATWRDVLAGQPTKEQRELAARRIVELGGSQAAADQPGAPIRR